MSLPFRRIVPERGRIMPDSARMVVVLPAPLEPISVTTWPFGTWKVRPCSTSTRP